MIWNTKSKQFYSLKKSTGTLKLNSLQLKLWTFKYVKSQNIFLIRLSENVSKSESFIKVAINKNNSRNNSLGQILT
jgi:hypothetical protein